MKEPDDDVRLQPDENARSEIAKQAMSRAAFDLIQNIVGVESSSLASADSRC